VSAPDSSLDQPPEEGNWGQPSLPKKRNRITHIYSVLSLLFLVLFGDV
jgi:hypothetical protein